MSRQWDLGCCRFEAAYSPHFKDRNVQEHNNLFQAKRCHVVWYIETNILEEFAVALPLLSEAFKGQSYVQLRYGMKPSLDKELYPPFWALKPFERLLQRFLRLAHGLQGVRKQFAVLLLSVVFTKVPASLYQLCKIHLTLKKNFSPFLMIN
jgi:hypothetical protein